MQKLRRQSIMVTQPTKRFGDATGMALKFGEVSAKAQRESSEQFMPSPEKILETNEEFDSISLSQESEESEVFHEVAINEETNRFEFF